MTTEETNEEIYRRIIEEIWTEENFDLVDELVADDCVFHDAFASEPIRGPEGMHEYVETLAPVLDGRVEIEQVIAKDDWIVSRFVARGTHVGAFSGIEPTNEAVEVMGIELNRFEDGKLVEGWQVFDALGMLQQIGALPEDVPTAAAGD